jgi:hypothetical protein
MSVCMYRYLSEVHTYSESQKETPNSEGQPLRVFFGGVAACCAIGAIDEARAGAPHGLAPSRQNFISILHVTVGTPFQDEAPLNSH